MHAGNVIMRIGTALMLAPASLAAQSTDGMQAAARDTGVSGIWILANLAYAGMRAQDNPSGVWRILSFLFGFPGTLISWLFVKEGSDRAYGVDLPRSRARAAEPPDVQFVRRDR